MLNKTWLVGLIGYVAYFVKQATGMDVPDQMVNMVADIVLLLAAIIPMVVNMFNHKKVEEVPKDEPTQYTGDSGPAV